MGLFIFLSLTSPGPIFSSFLNQESNFIANYKHIITFYQVSISECVIVLISEKIASFLFPERKDPEVMS
jgi:hypothetical protein